MSGGYVLIAGILFYILLLRTLDSANASPVKVAIIWFLGYYTLSSLVMGLEYAVKDIPVVPNLLEPMRITTALAQLVAATGIFYKIERDSDDYMSYMLWGGLGLVLLFFVVPTVVQQVFTAFIF